MKSISTKNKRKRAKLIILKYKDLTPRNSRYSDMQLLLKGYFIINLEIYRKNLQTDGLFNISLEVDMKGFLKNKFSWFIALW